MNWKRGLLAVLFLGSLLGAGATYIRIADVHAPAPDQRLDADQTPQAVIDQARSQFRTVEHRSVSRVYHVEGSGERSLAYVFEDVHDYDDRRYVANYATLDPPDDFPTVHHHWLGHYHVEIFDDEPGRSLFYLTDARSIEYHGDAADFAVGEYAVEDPSISPPSYEGAYMRATFLNHTTDWRVIEDNESTLVLGLDDPEEYYRTRPMWGVEEVHEGSSIRVHVDIDAGRVTRIVEDRIVTVETHVEATEENPPRYEHRRVHYRIETTFSDYGDVDIARPDGVGRPTVKQYLYDLLDY